MAWTTVATDVFDGDENPLATNWTQSPNFNANRKSSGLAWGVSAPGCKSLWDAAVFNDDQYAKGTTKANGGFVTRGSLSGTASGYLLYRVSTSVMQIYKYAGATMTLLGSNIAVNTSDANIILLESVGSVHTATMAGTSDSRTDSTTASGYAGIYCYGGSTNYALYDWEGGHDSVGHPTIQRWGGIPYMTLGRRKW